MADVRHLPPLLSRSLYRTPVLLLLLATALTAASCRHHHDWQPPPRETADRCFDWREARPDHPLDLWYGNPAPTSQLTFGCANAANIARQSGTASPEGPTEPLALAPAPARSTSAAVERYFAGETIPLPKRKAALGGR